MFFGIDLGTTYSVSITSGISNAAFYLSTAMLGIYFAIDVLLRPFESEFFLYSMILFAGVVVLILIGKLVGYLIDEYAL